MSAVAVKSKTEEHLDFDEIINLVRNFETGVLPKAQWNHRAHLTVACWYLICHAEPDATFRIREGIKKYNASQGYRHYQRARLSRNDDAVLGQDGSRPPGKSNS
jgi:hypothetical protein